MADERTVTVAGKDIRVAPAKDSRVLVRGGALPQSLTSDECIELGQALLDAGKVAAQRLVAAKEERADADARADAPDGE